MGRVFTDQFNPNSMLHARSITSRFNFAAGPSRERLPRLLSMAYLGFAGLAPRCSPSRAGPAPCKVRFQCPVWPSLPVPVGCQWERATQAFFKALLLIRVTQNSFPWRGAGATLATARGPS
jgi:hypothetical protein